LKQISPPLAVPGPTSPAQEIRGAVIAVEGYDKNLLKEVGVFIEETLRGDEGCAVRTWGIESESENEKKKEKEKEVRGKNTEMVDAGNIPTTASSAKAITNTDHDGEKNPFVDYLSIISNMHRKSKEIVNFITTIPSPLIPSPATSPVSQPQQNPQNLKTPIALLPNGFSLSTSDTFSFQIPINDSYAPIDHWQWMATLWRGIIGPDLTIIVEREETRHETRGSIGREETRYTGGGNSVEVRGEVRGLIVVRVVHGEGGLDEKTKRRLGFEVLEWVRGRGLGIGGKI
jgi:hypothetical protein